MTTAKVSKCQHGYDLYTETVVDTDERTACCGAFYTYSGDGYPYCRCCKGGVVGGDDMTAIVVRLPQNIDTEGK